MFYPNKGFLLICTLIWGKKNILSLKIKKKGKISIFLSVEKGFYERVIGEIIAENGGETKPSQSFPTKYPSDQG